MVLKITTCDLTEEKKAQRSVSLTLIQWYDLFTEVTKDHGKTQMFTLQFLTVAKSQSSSIEEKNFMVGVGGTAWGTVLSCSVRKGESHCCNSTVAIPVAMDVLAQEIHWVWECSFSPTVALCGLLVFCPPLTWQGTRCKQGVELL